MTKLRNFFRENKKDSGSIIMGGLVVIGCIALLVFLAPFLKIIVGVVVLKAFGFF